jgi:EF-P beta-lysylation protein EpmB
VQIIPENIISVESGWEKQIADSFTDPVSLLNYLELDTEAFLPDIAARKLFAMRVPRAFAAKMRKGDPHDPLLKQVLPSAKEFNIDSEFSMDPLQEQSTNKPGLLHKYQSRILLIVRGGCAVNCRYCFRRHFPYQDHHLAKHNWQPVFDYIANRPEINEVIYSGGDPLMASDSLLAWLTDQLVNLSQLQRLRIHTRLPVVIPDRVAAPMLTWFTESRLKPVMVLHINHANEIDDPLREKLQKLAEKGVTLLNQAVLLKGINDRADIQQKLSEALFSAGVLPYYLHMLDKVQGAAHFDVSEQQARGIMDEMIKRLPGYLIPKLVRELTDQPGKTPIDLFLHH